MRNGLSLGADRRREEEEVEPWFILFKLVGPNRQFGHRTKTFLCGEMYDVYWFC